MKLNISCERLRKREKILIANKGVACSTGNRVYVGRISWIDIITENFQKPEKVTLYVERFRYYSTLNMKVIYSFHLFQFISNMIFERPEKWVKYWITFQ